MRILTLAFLLVLAACGGSNSAGEEDKETVFDPLVQDLDKAKQVEDQVLEQKRQLDEALKEAEGGQATDESDN